MFKRLAGVLCAFSLVVLAGCWPFDESDGGATQSAEGASMIVMNVLDAEWFNDRRIQGSVNVPLMEVEAYAQGIDRNTTMVVYCANYACSASAVAWQMLDDLGFKKAQAYEGGMAEWHQKGLPSDGPGTLEYLNEPNEPVEQEDHKVSTISAEKLHSLMKQEGLL